MADPAPNSTDPNAPTPAPDPSSSQSVATEATVNGTKSNARETTEFLVKIEFVPTNNVATPVMSLHRQLMQCILDTHATSVTFFDKMDRVITKFTLASIRNVSDYHNLFDVVSRSGSTNGGTTRPAKHTIIMKFNSKLTLTDIKSHTAVSAILNGTHKIYLRIHHFDRTVVDVASPGWFYGKHPTQCDHIFLKTKITNRILAKSPGATIPFFHLAIASPSRVTSEGTKITTKAIEIQCDRRHYRTLDRLLKEGFRGNSIYIKYKWRHTAVDFYRDVMILQTKYLADCMTVPVHGITEKQMIILAPKIISSPACISVERTRATATTGRWNVLSTVASFRAATNHVHEVLSCFDELIPSSIAPIPSAWKKWNEDARTIDASSEGDQSYLTTSALSFASRLTDADRDNESSAPTSMIDFTPATLPKLDSGATATTTTLTDQTALINTLTEQVRLLTDQVARLMGPPTPPATALAVAPPPAATVPASIDIPPPATTPTDDRISHLEALVQQVLNKLQNQPNLPTSSPLITVPITDASDQERAAKKTDTKATPVKQSPTFEKARMDTAL